MFLTEAEKLARMTKALEKADRKLVGYEFENWTWLIKKGYWNPNLSERVEQQREQVELLRGYVQNQIILMRVG